MRSLGLRPENIELIQFRGRALDLGFRFQVFKAQRGAAELCRDWIVLSKLAEQCK